MAKMKKDVIAVWQGRGVVKVGNDLIGFGEEIPDSIEPKTLEQLKKDGLVIEKVPGKDDKPKKAETKAVNPLETDG